jgi:exportin-T
LHQSDVVDHPHREVLLLYYDLSVRYYPIFIKEPQLLPKLLGGLSGERGLLHAHPRVKSRSCYLLLRLVKSVIKVMRPYVETAVTGIQGEWVEHGNA